VTKRKRCTIIALGILLATSREAAADPTRDNVKHWSEPATLTLKSGNVVTLPPGYYVPEPTWSALDADLRRSQDDVTRLGAENDSLRASATAAQNSGLGWKSTASLVVGAFAAGILTAHYVSL
jgi:hypothetical protein